jgi:hypothetical protein
MKNKQKQCYRYLVGRKMLIDADSFEAWIEQRHSLLSFVVLCFCVCNTITIPVRVLYKIGKDAHEPYRPNC